VNIQHRPERLFERFDGVHHVAHQRSLWSALQSMFERGAEHAECVQRLPQIVRGRCDESRLLLDRAGRDVDLRAQLLHEVLVANARGEQQGQRVVLRHGEALQHDEERRHDRREQ
jgi:hypothetical protein